MKRAIGYFLVGIIACGVFFIAQAPAAFLWEQARQQQPQLRAEQVNGTLWQGSVQGLYLQPAPSSGLWAAVFHAEELPLNLSWRWRPLALFTGSLEFGIHARASTLDLVANVAVGWDRQLRFSALEAGMALTPIADLVENSSLAGKLQLSGAELGLDAEGGIVFANGELHLHDVQFLVGDNLHLGDYTARLITKTQLIEAEIKDQGGPLELTGVLQLKPGGNYRCSGQLGLRAEASPELRQTLALLGRPAADGKWQFNFTGIMTQ